MTARKRKVKSGNDIFYIRADRWRHPDSGTWGWAANTVLSGITYGLSGIAGSERTAKIMLTKACNAIARAIEAVENA